MAKKVLRRNISISGSAATRMGTGPLRVVYSSNSAIDAHIVSGMLEDSGIGCVLSNEFIAIVDNPVSSVTGGVKVQVRESNVIRAQEILQAQA